MELLDRLTEIPDRIYEVAHADPIIDEYIVNYTVYFAFLKPLIEERVYIATDEICAVSLFWRDITLGGPAAKGIMVNFVQVKQTLNPVVPNEPSPI